jgi:hypothetical protein
LKREVYALTAGNAHFIEFSVASTMETKHSLKDGIESRALRTRTGSLVKMRFVHGLRTARA